MSFSDSVCNPFNGPSVEKTLRERKLIYKLIIELKQTLNEMNGRENKFKE